MLLPAVALSLTQQQQTVFHQGNIQRMVLSIVLDSDIELPDSEGLGVTNLQQMYIQNVYPGKNVNNFGADTFKTDTNSARSIVIFIVLETASLGILTFTPQ